jgi:hypothetical protein
MPFLPPSSAGSRDRAPSSNRFRIAAYLDPQVGLRGTWGRDTNLGVFFFIQAYFHVERNLDGARKKSQGIAQLSFCSYKAFLGAKKSSKGSSSLP